MLGELQQPYGQDGDQDEPSDLAVLSEPDRAAYYADLPQNHALDGEPEWADTSVAKVTPHDRHGAWTPVDLDAVLAAGIEPPMPDCLFRRDGRALLYSGKLNVIFGAPESGKTWIALFAIAELVLEAAHNGAEDVVAVFFDYEDDARTYLSRLHSAGVPYEDAIRHTRYYSVDETIKTAPEDLEGFDTAGIVVVDPTNSAMTATGLDPLSNADALSFMAILRKLRRGTSAAWLLLDHEPISTGPERRQAIGAQAKFGAVDGAQYRAKAIEQPRPGGRGVIDLHVTKDRPGAVRRISGPPKEGIQHAATIIMNPRGPDSERFDWGIDDPRGVEGNFELRAAILTLEYDEEGESKTTIRELLRASGTKGRNELINKLIDELAADDELEVSRRGNHNVYRPPQDQSPDRGGTPLATRPEAGDRSTRHSGTFPDTATTRTDPGSTGDTRNGSPIPGPPLNRGTGRDESKPEPEPCSICREPATPGMLGGVKYCEKHTPYPTRAPH